MKALLVAALFLLGSLASCAPEAEGASEPESADGGVESTEQSLTIGNTGGGGGGYTCNTKYCPKDKKGRSDPKCCSLFPPVGVASQGTAR